MPLGMNYFNYFSEIEQEFVKRRGSHLLVSPLDWALIENWKQRGIPLHIVLRGINSSFESYDPKKRRGRKVNTLFFCSQEVEAVFGEYVESRVGVVAENGEQTQAPNGEASNGEQKTSNDSQFGLAALSAYLRENLQTLERLQQQSAEDAVLQETFERVTERLKQILDSLLQGGDPSAETLEIDLAMIEEVILDGLKDHAGEVKLEQLRKEARQQLRAYKQTMERAVYEQTLDNFIARQLRILYKVPRLSLFYL